MTPVEQRQAVQDFFNAVCEHLPDDWTIEIELMRDYGGAKLIDPDGEEIELCDDDMSFQGRIEQRVDHARVTDGLAAHFTPEPPHAG